MAINQIALNRIHSRNSQYAKDGGSNPSHGTKLQRKKREKYRKNIKGELIMFFCFKVYKLFKIKLKRDYNRFQRHLTKCQTFRKELLEAKERCQKEITICKEYSSLKEDLINHWTILINKYDSHLIENRKHIVFYQKLIKLTEKRLKSPIITFILCAGIY